MALALTRSAFAVAAIAERIAFLRSFAFTFSVLSVWGFGVGSPAALGLGDPGSSPTVQDPRNSGDAAPVPQERAEVLRPARSLGP